MGNPSSLQASKWDDLFQALTRPDDLKAYLVRNLNPEGKFKATPSGLYLVSLHPPLSQPFDFSEVKR